MTNPSAEAASGWFEGQSHIFPVRVYYEDTDFSGVVYHASYLRFMERGRSEFLRMSGIGHASLLAGKEPLVLAVRRMSLDFVRPAHIDEALLVHTAIRELTGARMRLEQAVSHDGKELVNARVEVCLITLDGRPRRVPDAVRKKLEMFLQGRETG